MPFRCLEWVELEEGKVKKSGELDGCVCEELGGEGFGGGGSC